MKTKREVLEVIAKEGHCTGINCDDCPYETRGCDRIRKIGAMAILRMFKKRKKPLLTAGIKIKFSDGRIATLRKIEPGDYYRLDFGDYYKGIDYLIGKIWEITE